MPSVTADDDERHEELDELSEEVAPAVRGTNHAVGRDRTNRHAEADGEEELGKDSDLELSHGPYYTK